MRLLLDTHALIWWWKDDRNLSTEVRTAMIDKANEVFVSAVTAWEIATKVRKGQLPEMREILPQFTDHVLRDGFRFLPVSADHGLRGGSLGGAHKDPFDRLLAAQALIENLTLISRDREIAAFRLQGSLVMPADTPLDRFKSVLGGTARVLSDNAEVELAFTADAPSQAGRHIKVPMPARTLPADQVAEARGFADSFALRLKHHDATLHARSAPGDAVARAVFDAVETARIEALGAKGYAGIADNLAHSLELKLRSDPIARARNVDEVPLSTAIGLLVRERLTGRAAPAVAVPGLALVTDWIEEKGGCRSRRACLCDRRSKGVRAIGAAAA